MILSFMGLEGKFIRPDSVFTAQLSAHSKEIHPKQSASVKLPIHSQVVQFCAEAASGIQPFLHSTGQSELFHIWMRNPSANISKYLPAQLDNSIAIPSFTGGQAFLQRLTNRSHCFLRAVNGPEPPLPETTQNYGRKPFFLKALALDSCPLLTVINRFSLLVRFPPLPRGTK